MWLPPLTGSEQYWQHGRDPAAVLAAQLSQLFYASIKSVQTRAQTRVRAGSGSDEGVTRSQSKL